MTIAVAASSAVIVVPILAPRVNGKTCLSVMIPAPAIGTKRLVVVEEDYTIIVTRVPASIPTKIPLPSALSRRAFALPVMTYFKDLLI